MTELALMTVEITVTDRNSQGFGLGGPKEQASTGRWPIYIRL
jgi:hypothetical protein